MLKKSFILLLLSVMLFSSILTGCKNTNEVKTPEEAPSDSTNVTDDESVEQLEINKASERGNVLTVAVESFDGVYSPILASDTTDINITSLLFNSLVRSDKAGNYISDLATYEISEDKLTYTFTISEGVKFHNGDELTSADVEFTYYSIAKSNYLGKRKNVVTDIIGSKEYTSSEVDTIEGIKIIDKYTISFTLVKANVNKIKDFSVGILNQTYSEQSEGNTNPVGTGPMVFEKSELGQYVSLKTNENYFTGRAKIDGVNFRLISDDAVLNSLINGEIDIANLTANSENFDAISDSNFVEVQKSTGDSYRYIGFNLRLEKFQDKRVRQALFYGLNINDFLKDQWDGFAIPCLTSIAPASLAYPNPSELINYSYQPEKAASLLEEAGWKDTDGDGFLDKNDEKFTITWSTFTDASWPSNLIEIAKENWEVLGIELIEDPMEFTLLVEKVYDNQDFEMYNMAWSLPVDRDPTKRFGESADVLGGFNAVGFHHERANEIFELASLEYNNDKRNELYKEWAKIVNEELPYIFVSIGQELQGINSRVKNYNYQIYSDIYYLENILDVELIDTTISNSTE